MFTNFRRGFQPGLRLPIGGLRTARAGPLQTRFYSRKTPVRPENMPRIRYLVMMVALSFGCLHFVTTKIERKMPKNSFSEREFEQYEKETGLKRRSKLVPPEKDSQYSFYAIPFAHDASDASELVKKSLSEGREVKVINPAELIQKELDDEGRYSYLLQEIKQTGRSFPVGLITALVKQEVKLFMNTTKGQYDTDIILMNYPQSTEEAIKFENDISDITSCTVLSKDFDSHASADLGEEGYRQINNVIGYFDLVDKVKRI